MSLFTYLSLTSNLSRSVYHMSSLTLEGWARAKATGMTTGDVSGEG